MKDLPHRLPRSPGCRCRCIRWPTIQALTRLPCPHVSMCPCVLLVLWCHQRETRTPEWFCQLFPQGGPALPLGPPWVGLAAVRTDHPVPQAGAGAGAEAEAEPSPGKPGPLATHLAMQSSCCLQPPAQAPTSCEPRVLVCDTGSMILSCLPGGTSHSGSWSAGDKAWGPEGPQGLRSSRSGDFL